MRANVAASPASVARARARRPKGWCATDERDGLFTNRRAGWLRGQPASQQKGCRVALESRRESRHVLGGRVEITYKLRDAAALPQRIAQLRDERARLTERLQRLELRHRQSRTRFGDRGVDRADETLGPRQEHRQLPGRVVEARE